MWLLLAFLAIPLVEIALFIQIGGAIGLGWTLAIVVFTAILGAWLVRTQGLMAMGQLRSSFSQLQDPTEPLAHGAMILVAGALLLTPGFFTDAVGFSLLVPPIRSAIYQFLRSHIKVQSFDMGGDTHPRPRDHSTGGDVIDGEFEEVKTPSDQPDNRKNTRIPKD